jgi:hypothetical protein
MAAKKEIPVVAIRGGLRVPTKALKMWLEKKLGENAEGSDKWVVE